MISMDRYVNIISGVGAGVGVAQRQLILRLVTQNNLLPPGVVAEFSSLDAVGSYFTTASEEYKRATAYLGFVSKSITAPQKISFARWVASAIAPMIVGDTIAKVLATFTAVAAGTLTLNVAGTPVALTAINLSTATSLTQVASLLQTAIRANANAQLTGATVTYNTNTNQFVLTGTTTGSGTIVAAATGLTTDVAPLLGWTATGTVNVAGQVADSPVDAVSKSAAVSNNFGSFAFCTPSSPLLNSDIAAVAAWNHAQNNMYMYAVPTSIANLATLYALVKGYSGCALNILSTSLTNDYAEQSPCEILASTNYNALNSVQGYMYYQFGARNVTVSDDITADTVDASRGNYIGVTQNAGNQLAFYQRGVLCGDATAAVDMNTYGNEMWLKSAFTSNIMQLFLSMPRVPANDAGKASILGVMTSTITLAKNNGTISVGKALNTIQKQYVTQISGDANAWRQIETIGYWLDIEFTSTVTVDGRTEWKAEYTLLYAKDDAIRSVSGRDIMI